VDPGSGLDDHNVGIDTPTINSDRMVNGYVE